MHLFSDPRCIGAFVRYLANAHTHTHTAKYTHLTTFLQHYPYIKGYGGTQQKITDSYFNNTVFVIWITAMDVTRAPSEMKCNSCQMCHYYTLAVKITNPTTSYHNVTLICLFCDKG